MDDPLSAMLKKMGAERVGKPEPGKGGSDGKRKGEPLAKKVKKGKGGGKPPPPEELLAGSGEGGRWVVWNERVHVPEEVVGWGLAGSIDPERPSGVMEVNRRLQVRALYKRLEKLCQSQGLEVDNTWFERWLFNLREYNTAGAEGSARADPLLPTGHGSSWEDKGLQADLASAGLSKNKARKFAGEMGKAAAKGARTLEQLGQNHKPARVKVSDVVAEGKRKGADGGAVVPAKTLSVGKTSVEINAPHLDKLRVLFHRHGGEEAEEGREHAFLEHAFSVALRYHTLHGGGVRGGGFQAALNGECFDVLLARFGVKMECFASPLNCRYGRFCSMFLDTDAPFGSVGDFFSFRPQRGSYEANPPFVPELMKRMEAHMSALLSAAEDRGHALQFVVVIPAWEETTGWQHLNGAQFNNKHLRMDARTHSFYEGLQHSRPTRSRVSTCPTSVFFLQTSAAAKRWPCTDEACAELEEAFAARH